MAAGTSGPAGFTPYMSTLYLQSQVKDFGLPDWVNRLTPLVEVTWSSPASKPNNGSTQYLFGVGVNYTAGGYALSYEMLIPGNKQTGSHLAGGPVASLLRRFVPEFTGQAAAAMVSDMVQCLAAGRLADGGAGSGRRSHPFVSATFRMCRPLIVAAGLAVCVIVPPGAITQVWAHAFLAGARRWPGANFPPARPN